MSSKAKITNILAFNFVCTNSFLFDGDSLSNSPSYILENWDRYCNFKITQDYKLIDNENFFKFRDNYNHKWESYDVDRFLEYFWKIQKVVDLEEILNQFSYYFGPINLVSSSESTGVHPILKKVIEDIVDSNQLKKIIRDLDLENLL